MVTLISLAFASPAGTVTLREELTGASIQLRMPEPGEPVPYVVGGERAGDGDWDDAVGVVFDSAYVGCTGTLVAPDVVLTAGHCGGGISHVIVGTKDWFSEAGELIPVRNTYVHPSYNGGGYDIAVLKLASPSSYPPRVIGNDCVLEEELFNGAPVTIAGFGNTQQDGNGSTSRLMMAESLVRDADCLENRIDGIITGCQPDLRPGGEIGAGGRVDVDGDGSIDQADACFGDSGGPLYLHTSRGDFVIGVTSRSFLGVDPNFTCRDGGIWTRPDAVMQWIESRAGVTLARPQCNDAPAVTIDPIRTRAGGTETSDVVVVDPDGTSFTVEVPVQPTLGQLVYSEGRLYFTAYAGVEGSEIVTVLVTDDGNPRYEGSPPITISMPVEILVQRGCGCASTATASGPLGMLLGLLALLRRRP